MKVMKNTLTTTLGFLVTMISKYTPLNFEQNSLEGISNYLKIHDRLTTSGQPTENQFTLIQAAGYDTVINLAPHHVENSLADEQATLQKLGLHYIHIPVDFKNPTEEDFTLFVETMRNLENNKIWIHCGANMRVSAFLYRYRCQILGEDRVQARKELEKIWEPFGVWKQFISAGSGSRKCGHGMMTEKK